MMNGSYTLELKTGGEIKCSGNRWTIEYYFPGPDLRYNGTFISIPGEQIDEYINAWKNNFKRYQILKQALPSDGEYRESGEMGMIINVGGLREGVGLDYRFIWSSQAVIDEIIADYVYAKNTAEKILNALKNI